MRIIDLIREIDFANETSNMFSYCGYEFRGDISDAFLSHYDLKEEDYIFRHVPMNDRYYSIGIGTKKLKGWIRKSRATSEVVKLDIQDFIEQDEFYLVLKYGKVILEEV